MIFDPDKILLYKLNYRKHDKNLFIPPFQGNFRCCIPYRNRTILGQRWSLSPLWLLSPEHYAFCTPNRVPCNIAARDLKKAQTSFFCLGLDLRLSRWESFSDNNRSFSFRWIFCLFPFFVGCDDHHHIRIRMCQTYQLCTKSLKYLAPQDWYEWIIHDHSKMFKNVRIHVSMNHDITNFWNIFHRFGTP